MKPISKLKYFQMTLFGQPACDRAVYRTIRKQKVASIVEIGLGSGARAQNMIRLALRFSDSESVRYTGVDMFDGREQGEPLALLTAHKEFGALGAKVRLVPGNISSAIPTIANAHIRTDLIVISGNYAPEAIENCWLYLPRMLHPGSTVLLQKPGSIEGEFQVLTRLDIERRASQSKDAKKTAAA